VSGFGSGTATLCVNPSGSSTCNSVGTISMGSAGRGQRPVPQPSSHGTYSVYVIINGTNYPSPTLTMSY
jgi:hypothetical protein